MLPLDQLKSDVEDRYRRIASAHEDTVDSEIAMARDWISRRPELTLALAEAEAAEPGLDFEAWRKTAQGYTFVWTARTEAGRAWLVWRLISSIADSSVAGRDGIVLSYASRFMKQGVKDLNRLAGLVVDQVLRPLFEYLIEHVQAGNGDLLTLTRYVARVEWYDRQDLFARFEVASTRGEDVLNLDLRRFLFMDAGIVTHAEEKSATGEPDLLAVLAPGTVLVCDGKIFDAAGRGKGYLAKGVRQVIEYAKDQASTTAHLIIYNITERLLRLHSDGPATALPGYLDEAGVRVYLHQVRLKPPATTASKLGKAEVIVVTRAELVTVADPT